MSELEKEASIEDALEEVEAARLGRRQSIKGAVFGLLGLIAIAALVVYVPRPTRRGLGGMTAGQEAVVTIASVLGVDEDAWSEVTALETSGNQTGLNQLVASGRAFVINERTRVVIVETRFTNVIVRALEGRNVGREGWINAGSLIVSQ